MAIYVDAPNIQIPPAGVRFFMAFARFEYALKASGLYAMGNGFKVEAWWDGFAKDLGPKFLREVRETGIAPTLLAQPPRTQTYSKVAGLSWQAAPALRNVGGLFVAVRRARNNLLHGGKFMGGAEISHARDEAILTDCLAVLDLALQRCPAVAMHF